MNVEVRSEDFLPLRTILAHLNELYPDENTQLQIQIESLKSKTGDRTWTT